MYVNVAFIFVFVLFIYLFRPQCGFWSDVAPQHLEEESII